MARRVITMASLNDIETKIQLMIDKLSIKTITGTLPLTFTTHTAGNADDWVIYGNDDNGTENLFGGAVEIGGWTISIGNPPVKYGNNARLRCNNMFSVPSIDTYTLAVFPSSYKISVSKCDSNGNTILDTGWSTNNYHTITNLEKCVFVIKNESGTNISTSDIEGVCIVKGSTVPDHYIPYQKGVGERTENLFNKDGATIGNYITINGDLPSKIYSHTDFIEIVGGEAYYLSHVVGISSFYTGVQYDKSKQVIGYFQISGGGDASGSVTFSENAKYIKINYRTSITNNMLIKGSTAPTTYNPYGYQIPLTVSQTGQTDKTVDIYIGDSPLTEGETVSKTSTGVDLELFEGENTISTTLYNNPEIKINYKWR